MALPITFEGDHKLLCGDATSPNDQAPLMVGETPEGHSVFEWNRWRIEVQPCEEIKRIENRGFARLAHGPGTAARVIVKQVRDTILIVVTVPL